MSTTNCNFLGFLTVRSQLIIIFLQRGKRTPADIFTVVFVFKTDPIHCRICLIQRRLEIRAKRRYAEHSAAGSNQFTVFNCGAGVIDGNAVQLTVCQPSEQMALEAVTTVLDIIEQKGNHRHSVYPCQIIERGSTGWMEEKIDNGYKGEDLDREMGEHHDQGKGAVAP